MWMNMLGYDTEFALVECMNSLFIDNFKLKTVGYLGLTMFLSRKSEVLLMVTNRLRLDLEDRTNDFVVSAALKTFSEIADDHMAQELFPILKGLLGHESKYIRKKVCLALKRVLVQKPELTLDLKPSFVDLLKENNNGLLLCTLHLAREIMQKRPKEFHNIFCDAQAHLLGKLRQTSSKSSGNYLINGVNDPFLQAELVGFLLEFLSLPQTKALDHFEDLVSEFGSCLLSVYREIQDFGGSTARAMFYQIARAIMQIPYSAIALKKVGIAILGSFLGLKNRNYLFVSLKMLCLISQKYSSEVSRHNSLIMKCVNDKDFSIKRLALEILLRTTDNENLREVCQLFFKELRKEGNPRRAQQMASQSLQLIQRAAASKLEIVDLIFELLQALQPNVKLSTSSLQSFFHLVANGEQTQLYSSLLALLLLGNPENRKKKTMLFAGCWVLGEFGESLTLGKDLSTGGRFSKVGWKSVVSVLLQVELPRSQEDLEVAMFVATAMLKIFQKVNELETKQLIVDWFVQHARKGTDSVAQKCRQYLRLMRLQPRDLEEILESWEFSNDEQEAKLQSLSDGRVELETLNSLAVRINQGKFVQEGPTSTLNRVVPFGEEHVLTEERKLEKEDLDLMRTQDNNGLQDEGAEMEIIDLLQMDVNLGGEQREATEEAVQKEPEMDLLVDDLDLGLGGSPTQKITSGGQEESDFLGMMGSSAKKNKDKLSQNIDQMMSQEMTNQAADSKEKKKGLGKPRSNLQKPKAKESFTNDIDFDFLGKDQNAENKPSEKNFDLLDDIDLMNPQNNENPDLAEEKNNLPKKENEYSALDELDDVLIRGTENQSTSTQPPNTIDLHATPTDPPKAENLPKDYDCLDLNNNADSLLTTPSMGKAPFQTLDQDEDFGDDEFEDCEVLPETPQKNYKTFFENNEILLEHCTETSGLNRYHIEHFFSSKVDAPLTGLRLSIQLQKHVKTKVNRLSSSSLGSRAVRSVTQTLELEDQSGFAKPLKIKMILKYSLLGTERVHQFIVTNFI